MPEPQSGTTANPTLPPIDTWADKFNTLLRERSSEVADALEKESTLHTEEGKQLKNVREFLRSCIEVGVRGWGNVDAGKGSWLKVVVDGLTALGC